MILPSKHIRLSESLLGLSAVLLEFLQTPISVDELWFKFSGINNSRDKFPAYHSFDNVVLALNILYSMGIVDIEENGNIYYATDRA
jgi:hypothetical protein